jgi:hypothetical protein
MQICTKCKISKPPSDFYRDKQKLSGLTSHCRACICQYEREKAAGKVRPIKIKPTIKTCSKCGIVKSVSEFPKDKGKCKDCKREYDKELHIKYPLRSKRSDLLRIHGITLEQYNEMLKNQNGVCAICKNPEVAINNKNGRPYSLSVDHCHVTGKNRELLCGNCNNGLGRFYDNSELLLKAVGYLEKHKES